MNTNSRSVLSTVTRQITLVFSYVCIHLVNTMINCFVIDLLSDDYFLRLAVLADDVQALAGRADATATEVEPFHYYSC